MSRRRLGRLVLAGILLLSCGPGNVGPRPTHKASPSPTPSGVTVHFAGNDTCPTSGQSPYFRAQLPVNSVPAVGQAIDEMPHSHSNPPATAQYNHDPPTSGCHYNLGYGKAPMPAGAYPASLVKDIHPENWVHNLEHGYIVVLYNCPSGCANAFNQLHDWLTTLPNDPAGGLKYAKVLILPEITMKPRFAVVCWDWYDPMDQLSISELRRFYDNHLDNSPERDTHAP